jgi:hypothetical protein
MLRFLLINILETDENRENKLEFRSDSTMMTAERGVALTIGSRAVSGRGSRVQRRPIVAQQKQASSEILQTTY